MSSSFTGNEKHQATGFFLSWWIRHRWSGVRRPRKYHFIFIRWAFVSFGFWDSVILHDVWKVLCAQGHRSLQKGCVYWRTLDPERICMDTVYELYNDQSEILCEMTYFTLYQLRCTYCIYSEMALKTWCMKKSFKWANVVDHCAMHSQAVDLIMCCKNEHLAFILKTNLVTSTFCNWLEQQVTVLIQS